MAIEIKVPDLPESVSDATVATWHKQPGDAVERDEIIVDIETDKVVLEVPAPESGVLAEILEQEGATVNAQQLIAKLEAGASAGASTPAPAPAAEPAPAPAPTAAPQAAAPVASPAPSVDTDDLTPALRRLVSEKDVDISKVHGTGKGGRVTKEDVEHFINHGRQAPSAAVASPQAVAARGEQRVPMTRLRKRIAERLLLAKNSTAMLTTFNEVNMKPIMDLRKKYQEAFEKRHGIRLGFMSFYVAAVVEALKRYPEVNACIDGEDIVYHNYFDVSIAVSTPRGLVTPVLRDCDTLKLADIEQNIRDLATKGRDGKLTVDELTGGNFTITNGGVFGSLMSTPIINPPQSAILGMHKIQERPMAVNGQVEILPMMYLALSYDHRIVDGRESVGFLVTIKELLEDPTRLVLDI